MPWHKEGFRKFVPNLTWQCNPQITNVVERAGAGSTIVDLGAGGRRVTKTVITVDFVETPETDIVGDVCDTPLDDSSADLVIATGLLEHVEDEDKLLQEISRILKPGGIVHIEIPFLQQHHDDPIDCRRYTVDGLERFLARHGFTPVNSGVHIGPTVTVITLFSHYIAILLEGPTFLNKVVSNGAYFVLATLLWPLKFLDRYAGNKKNAYQLAFGVFCTARKTP